MPEDERRLRMRALRQRIGSRDVHHWVQSFVEALGAARAQDGGPQATLSSPDDLASVAARLHSADRLLLLLDYDGTLVPFARAPDLAAPDNPLRDLLAALAAKPGVRVHVVSGRRREPLERWLGDLSIGLHAEHGYWSRMANDGPWAAMPDVSIEWKDTVRVILELAAATTPGTLVEEKTSSLAWHWRMAEPELGAARAEELWRRLENEVRGTPVELLRGEKVIELRPRGVTKARVVERLLAKLESPPPTIAAMGDDVTDEDTFRALPTDAITVRVGYRPSIARYRVATPREARALLARIMGP